MTTLPSPLYGSYDTSRMPLSFGIGRDRHLRVRCGACERFEEFDASGLLQRRLGGVRMAEIEKRLVCRCGRRGGQLEVWRGPPTNIELIPEAYLG